MFNALSVRCLYLMPKWRTGGVLGMARSGVTL